MSDASSASAPTTSSAPSPTDFPPDAAYGRLSEYFVQDHPATMLQTTSASQPSPPPSQAPIEQFATMMAFFQKTQEDNRRQMDRLVERVDNAAKKRTRDSSPKRSDCPHQRFNDRCIAAIDDFSDSRDLETLREGVAKIRQMLAKRTWGLEMNRLHPGYLDYEDQVSAVEKMKGEGIDDSLLKRYVNEKANGTITSRSKKARQDAVQPFPQRGSGNTRGSGSAQHQPLAALQPIAAPAYGALYQHPLVVGGQLAAGPTVLGGLQQQQLGHYSQQLPIVGQQFVSGLQPAGLQQYAASGRPPPTCFRCHQPGHVIRQCPYGLVNSAGTRDQQTGSSSGS